MVKVRALISKLANVVRNPRNTLTRLWRRFRPMRSDYRNRLNMTLKEWLLYHQRTIVFDRCSWMGVPALKNPFDSWIYQELIFKVRPDIIVEFGAKYGGSTLFFAHMLDLIGSGEVISVDLDRSVYNVTHPRIIVLTGDSISAEISAQITEICQENSVLIVHDANHSRDSVFQHLQIYWHLVTVGSYFIIEDGLRDLFTPNDSIGSFNDGPLPAIEQFLAKNKNFAVDEECERYILTYNPRGFLKRVH